MRAYGDRGLRSRLAALALLLALGSCVNDTGPDSTPLLNGDDVPTTSPVPTIAGGPVFAIGDSLMNGVDEQGHLGAILALQGWELETVAENGRSVRWAIDELEQRTERVPRFVVVVLGTNPGFSSDGFEEETRELRDALVKLGARRILWMPPHHTDPTRYEEKIAILKALDRADKRLVVPDWGAVLDAHPEWVNSDGIHLSEDGYAAMAAFIAGWLERLV